MRRAHRLTAAAVVAAGLVTGCGSGSGSTRAAQTDSIQIPASIPPGTTLRFADQLDGISDLLAWSGQNKNLPYTLQFSEFVGGPPMLQAFQAGAVDAGFVADTPVIFAQAAGQKIVGVAAWSTPHSAVQLVTAPGVHLSGWAALKGKKVAYQQGTVAEAVLLEGLNSVGLDLKDVTSVNLATTSIAPALERGSVAAGILVEPLTSAYLAEEPTASIVETGDDITARTDMIIASQSALANPGKVAAIADLITRLRKAYAWAAANPEEYAEKEYVQQYHLPLAEGEKLLAETGPASLFALPGPLAGPQQTLANLYYSVGEIPTKVDTADEFTTAFNRLAEPGQ